MNLRQLKEGVIPRTFHPDSDFGVALFEYLASQHATVVAENLSFQAFLLAEAEKLHAKLNDEAYKECDSEKYLKLAPCWIDVWAESVHVRDRTLADQVLRLSKRKSVCPIVIRGFVHAGTLQAELHNRGLEYRILVGTPISCTPLEEVLQERLFLDGLSKSSKAFLDHHRSLLLREPVMSYLKHIFDKSLRQPSLTTPQIHLLLRGIVDRFSVTDVNLFWSHRPGSQRNKFISEWIAKNCTDKEKVLLNFYIRLL